MIPDKTEHTSTVVEINKNYTKTLKLSQLFITSERSGYLLYFPKTTWFEQKEFLAISFLAQLLRVSEGNEVPISSHISVTSSTSKQL